MKTTNAKFPSAPLVNLATYIAQQVEADISKGAPLTPNTPAQTALTKAKSASKPSAIKATAATIKAFKGIEYNVRGTGAHKLFAHTAAWLELTGLIHGESAPVEVIAALGGSALRYHTDQKNMVQEAGLVRLTDKGIAKFKAREVGGHGAYAKEDMDAYMQMMIAGITDGMLVKHAGNIMPLGK